MSSTQIVALIIAVVVIAAVVLAAVMVLRRRSLRDRFGPEYERAVADADSRSAAEAELRERERRHRELVLTELTPRSKANYARQWADIQARFVERPVDAVNEADALVTDLIRERGYPTEDYQDALAHLSVEHAYTLGNYRDAHAIQQANARGEASTEDLRQAMVHYRTLFADVLGEQPVPGAGPNHHAPDISRR